MTTEQMDTLDDAKASAPTTMVKEGVHFFRGQANDLRAAAVDVKMNIDYDARNPQAPWNYKLIFPWNTEFRNFLHSISTDSSGRLVVNYENRSEGYITADTAQEHGERVAKEVIKSYSEYMRAQHQRKNYTLTIPVTH